MKYQLILFCLLCPIFLVAQNNTKKGVAVEGYDVVAYFNDSSAKGSNKFQSEYEGVIYKFSSAENKKVFLDNPEEYLPAYGGWCAYAMGATGDKVDIDPKTFEIRNGKLYLFYNKLFTNTLNSWLEENPEKLIPVADENWNKLKE